MMFLPLKRYADFSGRSRRMEFWLWALFNMIVSTILIGFIMYGVFGAFADLAQRADAGEFVNYSGPDAIPVTFNGDKFLVPAQVFFQALTTAAIIPGCIYGIWALATFIPNLAVIVRRMHDQDKSGWWILISFVPLIGGIWLLVLYLTDGTPGPNRFGPDPKGRAGYSPAYRAEPGPGQ